MKGKGSKDEASLQSESAGPVVDDTHPRTKVALCS